MVRSETGLPLTAYPARPTRPDEPVHMASGRNWQAEAGEMRLRAATIVLILLNIALGIALLAPSRSGATIFDGPLHAAVAATARKPTAVT